MRVQKIKSYAMLISARMLIVVSLLVGIFMSSCEKDVDISTNNNTIVQVVSPSENQAISPIDTLIAIAKIVPDGVLKQVEWSIVNESGFELGPSRLSSIQLDENQETRTTFYLSDYNLTSDATFYLKIEVHIESDGLVVESVSYVKLSYQPEELPNGMLLLFDDGSGYLEAILDFDEGYDTLVREYIRPNFDVSFPMLTEDRQSVFFADRSLSPSSLVKISLVKESVRLIPFDDIIKSIATTDKWVFVGMANGYIEKFDLRGQRLSRVLYPNGGADQKEVIGLFPLGDLMYAQIWDEATALYSLHQLFEPTGFYQREYVSTAPMAGLFELPDKELIYFSNAADGNNIMRLNPNDGGQQLMHVSDPVLEVKAMGNYRYVLRTTSGLYVYSYYGNSLTLLDGASGSFDELGYQGDLRLIYARKGQRVFTFEGDTQLLVRVEQINKLGLIGLLAY